LSAPNPHEQLASSTNLGTASESITTTLNRPGTYYLRVVRAGTGSTNYLLTMTATSTDTAGDQLITARNLGVLNATLSASDFVGQIDTTDFFQFSVAVPTKIQTSLTGADRALNVQVILNGNSNNSVDSGEVLASSASAVDPADPLTVLLPQAGTYFVRVLNGGANSSYTLNIATLSVGTFSLRPSHSSVHAGDSTRLSLAWTVPGGSWHQLKTVDLRLRDEQGIVAWIRFDESNNTFRLYDPQKNRFGPAKKPASHGVLSNRYVQIRLRNSSVTASGPNSPTVTLALEIRLKKKLAGRLLTVEAAASDDVGHRQDFAFAGLLDVL
jgi:hypothetical protein